MLLVKKLIMISEPRFNQDFVTDFLTRGHEVEESGKFYKKS